MSLGFVYLYFVSYRANFITIFIGYQVDLFIILKLNAKEVSWPIQEKLVIYL